MCDIGHVQKPEVLSNQSYFFSEIISTSPQMAGLEEGIANFVKLGLSRVKIQVTLGGRKNAENCRRLWTHTTHDGPKAFVQSLGDFQNVVGNACMRVGGVATQSATLVILVSVGQVWMTLAQSNIHTKRYHSGQLYAQNKLSALIGSHR